MAKKNPDDIAREKHAKAEREAVKNGLAMYIDKYYKQWAKEHNEKNSRGWNPANFEKIVTAQASDNKKFVKALGDSFKNFAKAIQNQIKATEKATETQRKAQERAAERATKAAERAAERAVKAQERAAERAAKAQERAAKSNTTAYARQQRQGNAFLNQQSKAYKSYLKNGGSFASVGQQLTMNAIKNVNTPAAANFVAMNQHLGALPTSFLTSPNTVSPLGNQFKTNKRSWLNRATFGYLGNTNNPFVPKWHQTAAKNAHAAFNTVHATHKKWQRAKRGGVMGVANFALNSSKAELGIAAALEAALLAVTSVVTALAGGVWLLKKAFFATWDYMDSKVLPTTSKLNRALGATTPGMANLRSESMKTALQFERLGLGFEHGADIVRTLAVNLKTADIPSGLVDTLVKVSEYTGMGAENAGKLARSFLSTGETTETLGDTLDSVMIDAGNVAKQFAVPANIVREQYGEDIDLVQRWGTANTHAMNVAIAKAASYNLSLRQLENTFGKNLDTFENSSDMASKLNAALGTSIDSVKLLNMNSDERMEYVRREVLATGFAWKNADKFAKNLLVSITGVKDEAEAADIFGSQEQREKALKRVAEQKMITNGLDEWKKALGTLGTQLTSVEQLTRNFFMAVGNVIAKLLGFDDSIDMTVGGVKAFEGFMNSLTTTVNQFAETLPKREGGPGAAVITWVQDLSRFIRNLGQDIKDVRNWLEDLTTFGEGDATELSDQYQSIINDTNATPEQKKAILGRLEEKTSVLGYRQSKIAYDKIRRDTGEDRMTVMARLDAGYAAAHVNPSDVPRMQLVPIVPDQHIHVHNTTKLDGDKLAENTANKSIKRRKSSSMGASH